MSTESIAQLLMLVQEQRCFDALAELYSNLNEDDMLHGLWKLSASLQETQKLHGLSTATWSSHMTAWSKPLTSLPSDLQRVRPPLQNASVVVWSISLIRLRADVVFNLRILDIRSILTYQGRLKTVQPDA